MRFKTQVSSDIVVRNLFERTADVTAAMADPASCFSYRWIAVTGAAPPWMASIGTRISRLFMK
jgi:hypothetical protein